MNKTNRRFYTWLRRFERWKNLNEELSRVISFTERSDCESPDDIQVLKVIHRILCECRDISESYLKEIRNNDRILR